MDNVAEVVARLRPDVLAMQEVEGCRIASNVSAAAAARIGLAASPWKAYAIEGADSFLRQQVAFLSTVDPAQDVRRTDERRDYPVPGSTCGFSGSTDDTGVSKNSIMRLMLGEVPVPFINTHFKAFPTQPSSCAKREAQATVLAAAAAEALAAGDEVVVLGDMNDFLVNGTLADAAGSQPTSSVFSILGDVDGDGVMDLFPAMALLPVEERYTNWWDHAPKDGIDQGITEHSQLDHILMTPRLYRAVTRAWIDHTHVASAVSDHWPFAVEGVCCGGACVVC